MAGEWIAWAKGLTRKREVLAMGRALDTDPRIVAATCMAVWEWADAETTDGTLPGLHASDIDAVAGVRGFAAAMIDVGWLKASDLGLEFPNWHRWNGDTAKQRIRKTRNKQVQRGLLSG